MAGQKASIFGFGSEHRQVKGRLSIVRQAGHGKDWTHDMTPITTTSQAVLSGDQSRRPLLILGLVIVAIMFVLIGKLFSLQIIGGERNLSLADGNRIRQKISRAPRGVIYDRNGRILARNTANFDLVVIPGLLPRKSIDRQAVYTKVSGTVGLSLEQVSLAAEAALQAGPAKTNVLQPILVSANMEREKALLLDQGSLDVPGFSLDINPVREYLDGGSLSQFLGYTGRISADELKNSTGSLATDLIGKSGLEKQYETTLRGGNGSEQIEVDASGRPIKILASKPAEPGSNISLSIDLGLQKKLAESLATHVGLAGSIKGSAVALDPRNGEVLAAVSYPSFDNNTFSHGISGADYTALLNNPGQPLFNKVTSGAYQSGSIIKPLVASAALQEHVITTATIIEDRGSLEVVNQYNKDIVYTFHGWERSGLGMMNIYRAIAMSSDIYFYTVAGGFGNFVGLGIDRLASYYQKFGLGQRTGIDLPEEMPGRVPTPEWKKRVLKQAWFTGDTYNIAVGQGDIAVSPLQMAVAIGAIANGGTMYRPHLLQQIADGASQVRKNVAPVAKKTIPISTANLEIVREAMRQTITSGTACCLIEQQVPVHVAGKTGTAETDPDGKRKAHAWFEAFAPYESPRIVIVALVENSGEGAEFAAPVVRETLKWYFEQPGNR